MEALQALEEEGFWFGLAEADGWKEGGKLWPLLSWGRSATLGADDLWTPAYCMICGSGSAVHVCRTKGCRPQLVSLPRASTVRIEIYIHAPVMFAIADAELLVEAFLFHISLSEISFSSHTKRVRQSDYKKKIGVRA